MEEHTSWSYAASAMTLLAYAVRRTIGALIVFLVVVLLTMFAVASINASPFRGGNPATNTALLSFWRSMDDGWKGFPAFALTTLGVIAGVVVAVRRGARYSSSGAAKR